MAYNNFKATIWAKEIQRALEDKAVLADFCNTQFEGDARIGGKVRILSVAAPAIGDYSQTGGLNDPETPDSSYVDLDIDKAKYFNFQVDDIDKAQSNPTLMAELTHNAGYGLVKAREASIAELAVGATNASAATSITTAAAAKKALDVGLLALREKGVSLDMDVHIELPHWYYQLVRDYIVEIKTDNVDLLKRGVIGTYDGATVVATNFIKNEEGVDHCMIRTKKAIGLATQINETEAYRPDKFFSDAIRGLMVYGTKIVRPDELYVIKAKRS